MTHQAFADKLLDLAYGELSPREAGKVEAHAASCEACRAELSRIRQTRSLMAGLPEEPAPERGERILLAAAREEAERRAARRRLPRWVLGASLAAASLLAVAAVSYRIIAMRPGPLSSRGDRDALLGESYTAAPQAAAPAPAADAARAEPRPSGARPAPPPAVATRPPPEAKKPAPALQTQELPAREFAEPPPAVAAAPAPPPPPPVRAEAREKLMAAPASPSADAEPQAVAPPLQPLEREGAGVRRSAPAPRAAVPGAASGLLGAPSAAQRREETRRFEGCEGEAVRRVERDGEGRVVTYVREGRFGGRHLRIVHTFRPDGSLAAATALDLDRGGTVEPRALGVVPVERAEDASIDAPPRCGR